MRLIYTYTLGFMQREGRTETPKTTLKHSAEKSRPVFMYSI